MSIHMIEESGETLPTSIANGAGIATNRNAIGPLSVHLPEDATLGDSFEVHEVEGESLEVVAPSGQSFRIGSSTSQSVVLSGGAAVLTRTKPGLWSCLGAGPAVQLG